MGEEILFRELGGAAYTKVHDDNSRFRWEGRDLTPREQKLTCIALDIFWMARRYANGRKTHAPDTINQSLTALKALGIDIPYDHTLVADGNSNAEYLDVTFQ